MVWGLQRLYAAWRAHEPLGQHFGVMGLGIVATSWLHFYYLPLLGGTLGFFAVGLLVEGRRMRRPWRPLVVGTAATLTGALLCTWGLLQLLDGRSRERTVGSWGYDSLE